MQNSMHTSIRIDYITNPIKTVARPSFLLYNVNDIIFNMNNIGLEVVFWTVLTIYLLTKLGVFKK